MKKIIIGIVIVIALAVAWYLISPLWRNVKVNESSPLVRPVIGESKEKNTALGARLVAEGQFMPRYHEVEGQALLIEDGDKKIVRFENFKTINGPDLRIYLSSDLNNRDIVDLGAIRATTGNVNYELPSGVDTKKYNKVLVWCRAFRVLFSYAELK